MSIYGQVWNTFEFSAMEFPEYDDDYEPAYGEPGHDYGMHEDGTPNPPPCIVCGVPLYSCVPIIDPLTGRVINE